MTLYLIDSNILSAEILNKFKYDENSKNILKLYRKLPLMKRVIADFILTEFELYMLQAFPKQFSLSVNEKNQLQNIIYEYLRQINHNFTLITPNTQIVKNAFSLYSQFNPINVSNHISLTDCLLLSTAIQLQYTLITLDQNLTKCALELKIPFIKSN